jgi:hypothetical protein
VLLRRDLDAERRLLFQLSQRARRGRSPVVRCPLLDTDIRETTRELITLAR